ncbi:glutaredoxin family protein [Parafrigoribacterium soli]|uniref:glutaredoxin family protein n=1 Tax=Parafrigoribacterium soli TaxID=3144663 RepID=UPI0032EBCF6D
MPETVSLTLIGKPECHLCEDARVIVKSVMADLEGEPSAPTIALEELSILDDSGLFEKYVEEIPVLLLNGRVHNIWRIDAARLRSAILDAR